MESLIFAAKNTVTQIVDKNTGEDPATNNYRLSIDNNQLNFYRDELSDDLWLKLYGTTTSGTDGIVQETNRNNWFYESTDGTNALNSMFLRYSSQVNSTLRAKEAPLRLQ